MYFHLEAMNEKKPLDNRFLFFLGFFDKRAGTNNICQIKKQYSLTLNHAQEVTVQ